MPGNTTTYAVNVKYQLDADKATSSLKGMATQAEKTGESIFSLKGACEALALHEVFKLGKEALVDFNSEMDSLKIGMTTVMQMNLHLPFQKARTEADKLFDTFQQLAKKSPVTTADFMHMASNIAAPVAMAGGGPDKLAKITQGAVIAGLAYGKDSQVTSMAIEEMLGGKVRKTNPLAMSLVGSTGKNAEQWNAMSGQQRAMGVESILSAPALKAAADRFGETFKGQTSTLKDNLQIALGEVGKPLMQAMTAEVSKWNHWIEKHPKLIAETGQKLASMIKGAFEFVTSAGKWLVDNKETLFSIGKMFLVFKGAQLGTGLIKSFVEGVGSLGKSAKEASMNIMGLFSGNGAGVKGAFGSLTSALTGAGGVVAGLAFFGGGLYALGHFLEDTAEKRAAKAAANDLYEAGGDYASKAGRYWSLKDKLNTTDMSQSVLKGYGVQTAESRKQDAIEMQGDYAYMHDVKNMATTLRAIGDASEKNGGKGFSDMKPGDNALGRLPGYWVKDDNDLNTKIADGVNHSLVEIMNAPLAEQAAAIRMAYPERYGASPVLGPPAPDKGWNSGEKPNINVTIQRIEVASEDPDRFVFNLAKVAEQSTKHKTQSSHTISGGL